MLNLLIHWAKVGLCSEMDQLRLARQECSEGFYSDYLDQRSKSLLSQYNRVLRFERWLQSSAFSEEVEDT